MWRSIIWRFFSGAVLVGFGIPAFATNLAALDTLKEKYEAGQAKVNISAYSCYTNGLSLLMQKNKASGDLDAFLVLQNEQKALIETPVIPTGEVRDNLSAKVTDYIALMAKIDAYKNEQLDKLQKQYIARLDALLKELMASDRIEDAKLVKSEKDAILGRATATPGKDAVASKVDVATAVPPENQVQAPIALDSSKMPAEVAGEKNRAQAGGVKPAKELIIMKATLTGVDPAVDVTALLQERVVDGALVISDFNFLEDKYRYYYYYRERSKALLIQYKYKGGMIKSIRKKYGEPISITE